MDAAKVFHESILGSDVAVLGRLLLAILDALLDLGDAIKALAPVEPDIN